MRIKDAMMLMASKSYKNIISNGNITNGTTGWSATNSGITAVGGVLKNTANTTVTASAAYNDSIINISNGYKVFIRAKMRTTSAGVSELSLRLRGSTSTFDKQSIAANQTSPVRNQWYDLYGYADSTELMTGNIRIVAYTTYVGQSSGLITEIDDVIAIMFASGTEPTAEWCYNNIVPNIIW